MQKVEPNVKNKNLDEIKILAFESSCDDTSIAAVAGGDRLRCLSFAVQSQDEVHRQFGGIVPDLASRAHLENLIPCLRKVFEESKLKFEDFDAFAATARPGLMGSLLIGHSAAKALSYIYEKPFISCHHLEAHLASVQLEFSPEYPLLTLLVSGGHSSLYLQKDAQTIDLISQTRDDACGEALDKGAKLLGLNFPGGAELEALALNGDPQSFEFSVVRVEGLDFSFSGLKSQLNRLVQKSTPSDFSNLAASYQRAVFDHLIAKTGRVLEKYSVNSLAIVGGVARNQELRQRLDALKSKFRIKNFYAPSPKFCTDNAAMVGALAIQKFRRGEFSDLNDDVSSTSRPPIRRSQAAHAH